MFKFRISQVTLTLIIVSLIAGTAVAASCSAGTSCSPGDSKAALEQWRGMKYGMFIHWGIYSLCEGIWKGEQIPKLGEQIQRHASIPQDEYAALASRFNPVKFDADKYVEIAKNAGMKYIIITSKHHDGFNMFHSALSDYNIIDATPYEKDIIKELADACARGGLKFGLYYSNPDWGFPGAVKRDPANEYSVFETITPEHEEYEVGQLEELLTNYGPIFELFFDMGTLTHEQSKRFADTVHRVQPNCLVSGRVMNDQGDFLTMPDNHIPDEVIPMAWETPATLYHNTNTNTWGYKSWVKRRPLDEKVKEQIRLMAKVVSRGGNYLLNVGPKADGTIIDYEINILKGMGDWMKVNGESIYETEPTPFKRLNWGHATVGNGKLYLHVFEWPVDGKLVVPGLKSKVKKAYILSDKNNSLSTSRKGDDLVVKIPATDPGKKLSVVALELKGKLNVADPVVLAEETGIIKLTDDNGFSHGYYTGMTYKSLHRDIWKSWDIAVEKGGRYSVELAYEKARDPKEIIISIGDESLNASIDRSSGMVKVDLGVIELKASARQTLSLKSTSNTTPLRFTLDHIKLTPQ